MEGRSQSLRPPIHQAWQSFLHLRCPHCARGRVFGRWFQVLQRCPSCGLAYFRESGYFIGGMIVDYIATAFLVTAIYLGQRLLPDFTRLSSETKLAMWLVFAILLALALMRHSYSFWLAADYWLEPWDPPADSQPSARRF
jgi:uncharacterized protein (DUF983 family)